ncbi:MAG: hypothetical protein ACLP1W_02690 [Rhodomicrobium sp.]
MHMPLSPIDRAYSYAIAPPVFAFRKFMAVDRYAEKQKSRLSWRIYRPSVVLAFFLYGLSNVLWFTLFGAGCLIAVLPVIAADWVGGLWLLAGIIWGMALRATSAFWSELGRIAKWTMLAITPQFVFLAAYNGFSDQGETARGMIGSIITTYELAAVRVNEVLSPVSEVPWSVWAILAFTILAMTWITSRPRLLTESLAFRSALQNVIFGVAVTASIGFSYTKSAGEWEPSVQKRLEAHLKDKVRYEASIELSEALVDWFKRDPGRVLPLIALSRNLEKVLDEARRSPEHYASEDIDKALKSSIKSMVPKDLIEPSVPLGAKLTVEGSTPELLEFDAGVRSGNRALGLKAQQVRAAATAFVAQVANISVTSVPLLNEVLGEMINAAAEQAGRNILDRLPLEEGIKAFQASNDAVKSAVASNMDRIGSRVFWPKEGAPEYALGLSLAALRERFFEQAYKSKAARIQTERVRARVRIPPL